MLNISRRINNMKKESFILGPKLHYLDIFRLAFEDKKYCHI